MASKIKVVVPEHGEEFRKFIVAFLERGELNKDMIHKMTHGEYFLRYSRALTHKTFSKDLATNYEYEEFFGDRLVNACVTQYVKERFPQIRNVEWLTKLMQNLSSKKILGEIGLEYGYWKYLKYGTILGPKVTEEMLGSETVKQKILGDIFEALIGVTCDIVNFEGGGNQIGFAICYNIIHSYLQEKSISLNVNDVFDAKSRLKAIMETHKELGKLKKVMVTQELAHPTFIEYKTEVKIPRGSHFIKGYGVDKLKRTSENIAAQEVMDELKKLDAKYVFKAPLLS
ncbi:MAG TPA: ribonuclease III domain-containing protein [Nitrosarchaeum sp.]|nr:ribonuclease III domain-containing protein [Nitrosarchaeum sp.]